MMMRLSILLVLSLWGLCSHAQTIAQGQLLGEASKAALPYVNIGIVGKNVGTVSDIDGHFSLPLDSQYDADTLKISTIGYESLVFTVADFKASLQKSPTILLQAKTTVLEEILVSDKALKEKILGNKTTSQKMSGGFSSNDLGNEVGIIIKIKKSPTYLKSFQASIVKNDYGKIKFRLNIYNLKDGMPDQNILKENIFVSTDIQTGILSVDLSPYQIVVEDDFFISLEWIENLDNDGLYFSVSPFGSSIIERKTSQGNWNKIGIIGIGLNVKALY